MTAGKTFESLLSGLTDRQKEVIEGRFGLSGKGEMETLAAIGDRMQVTRERIRQIERSALEVLKTAIEKNPQCTQILETAAKILQDAGGVMKRDVLLDKLSRAAKGITENHLALLLEATNEFHEHPEDEDHWAFYYFSKNDLRATEAFTDSWAEFLGGQKENVLARGYQAHFKEFVKKKHMEETRAQYSLGISRKFHSNTYGDIGLREWPEIRPQTTRDRAYLVMKKTGEPLHFSAIADAINAAKLTAQTALAPTVHNELIKDERFVLVGRGTYALREQGYEPGIAREVIQKVLKHEGPLKTQDVVERVQKQRLFKPNTIIINLQNKTFFERMADGKYRVRES
ncbi:MAG TPA: sigma factor-like helix-turn-helix DNA-binding protein [Candidatus Paceibacterota bacterium]|nr:sigma factor-like helix-turn-helix DNA-binding protein [Candidatus Paceibacterota bacterium]